MDGEDSREGRYEGLKLTGRIAETDEENSRNG
jgi:hypothetical protein